MSEPDAPDATPKKGGGRPRRAWHPAFIAALANSGNIRASCQAAGIDRHTAYRARDASATFRQQWDDALEEACDVLEAVARQRAVSGESDTLLIFLLKSHRPAIYREQKALDVTTGGLPLTLAELMLSAADEDDDAPVAPTEQRNGQHAPR